MVFLAYSLGFFYVGNWGNMSLYLTGENGKTITVFQSFISVFPTLLKYLSYKKGGGELL